MGPVKANTPIVMARSAAVILQLNADLSIGRQDFQRPSMLD